MLFLEVLLLSDLVLLWCASALTFSLTSSETVRDSMRQDTAQLMMWKRVYMTRVLVEDLTGGQKAQQSEQGAGPQQQHI